jgi:hypothetical protein
MKPFLNYLTESEKTYEFRIKIANIDPNDQMDRLESVLEAYCLESLSKPKRLPIKESDIDFPSFKNCQLYLMDVTLKYPCNNDQLRAIIAERMNIPAAHIVVVPLNHPEEQRRWDLEGNDVRVFAKGESVLDKPYEDNAEGTKAGKDYAASTSLLKELSKPKMEIEGDTTPKAKTLNDIPQGESSPVGSKQNKIPSAVKGK